MKKFFFGFSSVVLWIQIHIPFFFLSKVVNVFFPVMCMFVAQEDQSETSQQTAASDEEKGMMKQVLTSVIADKMSVVLLVASWAVSISYS